MLRQVARCGHTIVLASTTCMGTHGGAITVAPLLSALSFKQQPRALHTLTEEQRNLIARTLLVDTLALTRKFEGMGISREQAEAMTTAITDLIISNKMKMDDAFVGKKDMEKTIMEQEGKFTTFKTEVSKSHDNLVGSLHKDIERQQSFLEKMRTEVRHEIDKLTASQRLDLNLEKGRMRDDLQVIRDKTTDLEIKVDRDINELRSSVEKAKNDTIKSVITILGTFSAIAFTITRFVQMGTGGG